MHDEGAVSAEGTTFTGTLSTSATFRIDAREVPVEVVFADGHREPLELPPDATAIEVVVPPDKTIQGRTSDPRGLRAALLLLEELTRLVPPPEGRLHTLYLSGGTLKVLVPDGEWFMLVGLDAGDLDRPIHDLAATLAAGVKGARR